VGVKFLPPPHPSVRSRYKAAEVGRVSVERTSGEDLKGVERGKDPYTSII
jgi:hypothetical protein